MNATANTGSGPSRQRWRQLQAIGIQPWRLRGGPVACAPEPIASGTSSGLAPCVVLLPTDIDTRSRDLLARALQTVPALARAGTVQFDPARPGNLVAARAYLLLDPSLEPVASAQHGQVPRYLLHPAGPLTSAAGKRQLWQLLRAIRRQLAGGADGRG